MADVAKLLNLQPQPENTQLVNINKVPPHQFIPPVQVPQSPSCPPTVIKLNFHPNSDYVSYMKVYCPFTQNQPSPDDIKSLLTRCVQSLRPLRLPTLSEMAYYKTYLVNETAPLKWSYGQIVEVVDLAAQLDRNFTVVASRVKRSSMNAIQCMEAFGIYAIAILQLNPQITPENKKAIEILSQFKERVMGNSLTSKQIMDEHEYQVNQRETEACFSPLRLIGERFEVMNESLQDKIPTGDYFRTDFSQLVQEQKKTVNAKPVQQQYQLQIKKPVVKTEPGTKQFQPSAYQLQLLKSMNPPVSQPKQVHQPDLTYEHLRAQAQAKVTFQTLFTNQNQSEKIQQICDVYNANPEEMNVLQTGTSGVFRYLMLQNLPPGKIIANCDVSGFPGHHEIDFNDERVQNVCVNANQRWTIDESTLEEWSGLKQTYTDMKKCDAREIKDKAQLEMIQKLRKELATHAVDLKGFFQLEKHVHGIIKKQE
ncbi:Conserved_hypothetical protein [Hexamita inflata]|uniref:Uncharacterized protein n=1 Tax=Hexamita inflata TaxID=28002 RepID=A0AA86RGX9_9EUKA|nr:Conserved hypothetical protein [Hexamita inflata]